MNKLILPAILISLAASPSSWARHEQNGKVNWAKVTNVHPITRTIEHRIPREECWNEQVRYKHQVDDGHSYTGTILGGVIGGAIGNAVGHKKRNKQIGTAVGVVLGASIGHDLSNRGYANSQVSYQDERHCELRHESRYEERVIGYHVWYRYHGHEYKTRMDHHPGKKIKVHVNVEPY